MDKSLLGVGSDLKERMSKCRQLMWATLCSWHLEVLVFFSTTCIRDTSMIPILSCVAVFVMQVGFDVHSVF